ncbi:MAG: elongation factor P [bacterium]
MLSISDLKKVGTVIEIDGEPYEIIDTNHKVLGRGGAVLNTKLKNLINGNVIPKTFKGNEVAEEARLDSATAQYLYKEGEEFFFMNSENFDQFSLPAKQIGDLDKFLVENEEVEISLFKDKPIKINLPIKVTLTVKEAPPAIRGNTADGGTKEVTLVTGHKVNTPLFISEGDKVIVDTRDGTYVERAK